MKISVERTKKYFENSMDDKHFEFLKLRKINSELYINSLRDGQYGMMEENSIRIGNEEYMVTYILGQSSESIYDLIRVNQIYGIAPEEGTVFAILLGDDYLFFKPDDEKVYFYCRDTEDGIVMADNYKTFLESI